MINVEGNLKIENYNDNSGSVMTFSPEGTLVEQTIVTTPDDQSTPAEVENIIHLNSRTGCKIDLFRVIIALQKSGFFLDKTGSQATQKDVFNAFGTMLGEDFSKFQKNLSEASKHNNDSAVSSKIFDTLKEAFEAYEDK